jgi:hypothetical protein
MLHGQFAAPVLISGGSPTMLERVDLSGRREESGYDESWLQRLLFEHPAAIPVAELDTSYEGMVPVCCELATRVGYIDALYATRSGKLVLLEAKLWRNPEARRKVVGQILEYASELSRWTYEDLQREVCRATGRTGNAPYHIVAERHPDAEEARFVDEVSRSLRTGRFLLLIAGDGIREGVQGIAGFLEQFAYLEFTFGLMEVAVYRMPNDRMLIQPRILAKSLIFRRSVVSLREESLVLAEDDSERAEQAELTESQEFYRTFWTEFLAELRLDDVSQPLARPTRSGNVFFALPPSMSQSWVTVYFSQAKQEVGVFLTFRRGELGDLAYERLLAEREEIEAELGPLAEWRTSNGKHTVTESRKFPRLHSEEQRHPIKEFLAEAVNRFVNAFRPRLVRITGEVARS